MATIEPGGRCRSAALPLMMICGNPCRHAGPLAAACAVLVLLSACGGGDSRPRIDEGPPPELRSYTVEGSAESLPIVQREQIDSRSNDGRFTISWEISEAKGYDVDLHVSSSPYPSFFSPDAVGFASLYCWEDSANCGLIHTLPCRFDTNNVLRCEGQRAVDLTQWLGELPRKAWIVIEACNGPFKERHCASSAVEVEFR